MRSDPERASSRFKVKQQKNRETGKRERERKGEQREGSKLGTAPEKEQHYDR